MDKMTAMRMRQFFLLIFNSGYACAMIVHTRADQLLPQLSMVQLDTLPKQCIHIDQCMKEFVFKQINIDKNLDIFSDLYLIGVMLVL